MKVTLNRQKLGLEDLEFGTNTVIQTRGGKPVTITQINASNLPFDNAQSLQDVYSDMQPLLDNAANINAAANNINNINIVASNVNNINIAASNVSGVNTVATNIMEVLQADINAQTATQKALEASNSASAAATSETNAKTSEINAKTSATSATNSMNSASISQTTAYNWATYTVDSPVPEGDGNEYSARHWANKAALAVNTKQDILSEGAFVNGDKTKLDGIEVGATADQTGAEIKTLYEAQANTNAYTDLEKATNNKIDNSLVTSVVFNADGTITIVTL